jgi:hypothetical protein
MSDFKITTPEPLKLTAPTGSSKGASCGHAIVYKPQVHRSRDGLARLPLLPGHPPVGHAEPMSTIRHRIADTALNALIVICRAVDHSHTWCHLIGHTPIWTGTNVSCRQCGRNLNS